MNIEQERAELLPCPFCGGTNIEIQISTPDREGVPTNLMCSDCGASGPWEYEQVNSHAKADAAWNTRTALPTQPKSEFDALQSQDREDAERYRTAFNLLKILFEAWENGPACYNNGDRDEYIGNAFLLDDKTFHACVKVLSIDHARRIEEEL